MTRGLKPMVACIIRMCTFPSSGGPLDFRKPPLGKGGDRLTMRCEGLAESQTRGVLHRLCRIQIVRWAYSVPYCHRVSVVYDHRTSFKSTVR